MLLALLRDKKLRARLLFTLSLLATYRLLAHIPLPFVDREALRSFLESNDALSLLSLLTGGSFRQFSIVLLGVGPYITSSIIFQLLSSVVPSLERLQKDEGEFGRQQISRYTRLSSIPIAFVQGFAFLTLLRNQGVFPHLTALQLIAILIVVSAGSTLLLWLGELITEYGLGNGISLIITLGIVAGFPGPVAQIISIIQAGETGFITKGVGIALTVLIALFAVVVVTEARRNLPVLYARRLRSLNFSYSQVRTELPLLLNVGGVVPIIFALSVVSVPPLIASLFRTAKIANIRHLAELVTRYLQPQHWVYALVYFSLVIFFSFFYALVIVGPKNIAEQLGKQGGYIAGVRPGEDTIAYLTAVMTRLTLFGSVFLALIAILPFILQEITGTSLFIIGGTGLLIVVSVVIETMRGIQSQLLMTKYS